MHDEPGAPAGSETGRAALEAGRSEAMLVSLGRELAVRGVSAVITGRCAQTLAGINSPHPPGLRSHELHACGAGWSCTVTADDVGYCVAGCVAYHAADVDGLAGHVIAIASGDLRGVSASRALPRTPGDHHGRWDLVSWPCDGYATRA